MKSTRQRNQNNSERATWILNIIDPSISLSLQAFSNAFDMWSDQRKIYHQDNIAKKFYIDTELAKYY